MLSTVLIFLLTLCVLVTVHEYGHYRVAVACGVRVLRFSVGFGQPLLRWRSRHPHPGQDTEFVVSALPLGGYIRLLDERHGPVEPAQQHQAFNRQSLKVKSAIVLAGPLANLLLALVLYAGLNWAGAWLPLARLGSPVPGSLAERAGFQAGDLVLRMAETEAEWAPVRSYEEFRWRLAQAALRRVPVVRLELQRPQGQVLERELSLGGLSEPQGDARMFRDIGWLAPWSRPVIARLVAGEAGQRAGLQVGDVVLQVDGWSVSDSQQLRELIRAGVQAGQGREQLWRLRRGGSELELAVRPQVQHEEGQTIGRLGLYIGEAPQMAWVRYGPFEGLSAALEKTMDVAGLSLRIMGQMVLGQASVQQLSGPVTMADYAGRSLQAGWAAYLAFLALVSVSLGVFNLIPLPVLDGGHLLYYLCQYLTGRRLSELWLERLQRAGVALLMALMALALFNDFSRIWT